jgi:hypothetical protein
VRDDDLHGREAVLAESSLGLTQIVKDHRVFLIERIDGQARELEEHGMLLKRRRRRTARRRPDPS